MSNFIKSSFLSIDRFGETFQFRVQKQRDEYKSCEGTVLTLIMFALIMPFAAYRFNSMLEYSETNVVVSTQYNHFDSEFVISS